MDGVYLRGLNIVGRAKTPSYNRLQLPQHFRGYFRFGTKYHTLNCRPASNLVMTSVFTCNYLLLGAFPKAPKSPGLTFFEREVPRDHTRQLTISLTVCLHASEDSYWESTPLEGFS